MFDHPLFTPLLNVRLRLGLRRQGVSRDDINSALDGLTPEIVSGVAAANNITIPGTPVGEGVGAIGDGTILKAILAFLQSDQGKALVDFLLKLLMGLLVA